MQNLLGLTRVLALVCACAIPLVSSAQDIHWLESYDEAFAEAKRSGKPILLTFRCAP